MKKEYSEKIDRLLSYYEGYKTAFTEQEENTPSPLLIKMITSLEHKLSEADLKNCIELAIISGCENKNIEECFYNAGYECLEATGGSTPPSMNNRKIVDFEIDPFIWEKFKQINDTRHQHIFKNRPKKSENISNPRERIVNLIYHFITEYGPTYEFKTSITKKLKGD